MKGSEGEERPVLLLVKTDSNRHKTQKVTVAILAQGTHWGDAVNAALFFFKRSKYAFDILKLKFWLKKYFIHRLRTFLLVILDWVLHVHHVWSILFGAAGSFLYYHILLIVPTFSILHV